MKLKYPLGDLLALAVVIIGTIFDLLHHPNGKQIFYSGFILLALSHLYYRIYIPKSRNQVITWKSFVYPALLIGGAALFFIINTKSALVLIFFGLTVSFAQRNNLLTESK